MRPFRKLLVASLKEFMRDRTSLSFTIILPLLLVAFFGFAYSDSTTHLSVGVVGLRSQLETSSVVKILRGESGVTIEYGSKSTEMARLHDGTIDAVLTGSPSGARSAHFYYDRGDATVALAVGTLSADVAHGGTAIKPSGRARAFAVSGLSNSRLDFVIPGILATAIMWLGIFAAIPLVQQREQQVLRRLAVTPLARWRLVLAQVLGRLFVSLAQALLVLAAARLLFGVPIGSEVGSGIGALGVVAALVLLGALGFVAIGYAVAALSSTQSGAHAWAQLLTMPMLLLSGVFFPIALMPGALKPIIGILPLTYLADALRQTAFSGQHFVPIQADLGALAVWVLIPLVIAIRYFRWA